MIYEKIDTYHFSFGKNITKFPILLFVVRFLVVILLENFEDEEKENLDGDERRYRQYRVGAVAAGAGLRTGGRHLPYVRQHQGELYR